MAFGSRGRIDRLVVLRLEVAAGGVFLFPLKFLAFWRFHFAQFPHCPMGRRLVLRAGDGVELSRSPDAFESRAARDGGVSFE